MWYRPENTNIDLRFASVNIGILWSTSHFVQWLNSQLLYIIDLSVNKQSTALSNVYMGCVWVGVYVCVGGGWGERDGRAGGFIMKCCGHDILRTILHTTLIFSIVTRLYVKWVDEL